MNECASSPCGEDAVCVDGVDNFFCICPDGYTGKIPCIFSLTFRSFFSSINIKFLSRGIRGTVVGLLVYRLSDQSCTGP